MLNQKIATTRDLPNLMQIKDGRIFLIMNFINDILKHYIIITILQRKYC